LGEPPIWGGQGNRGAAAMMLVRLLIAAIVLILFQPALAEQLASPAPVPAEGAKAEPHRAAQPPALVISGPYEDAERHLVRTYGVKIGMKSVAFLPDGRSALIAGVGGIQVLDLVTGREILSFAGNDGDPLVFSTAISRDGRYVLAGKSNVFALWDIANGRSLRTFNGHRGFVNALAITPDGRYGLSGGADGRRLVWDLRTGQIVHDFQRQGGRFATDIKSIAITPDGRYGLTGGGPDAPLELWDLQTGRLAVSFEGNKIGMATLNPSVSSLAISPGSRTAITGGSDKMLYLWDLKTGKQLRKIAGNPSGIQAVALSPDGRFAVTGNEDQIKLWLVSSGKELHEFASGLKHIYSVAFSSDGRFILSGGMGDSLRLWDASAWTKAGK
jgi:WD40 repeat protein